MEKKEFLQLVIELHNRLVEINVRGDDAIRMAEVLQCCRAFVSSAGAEQVSPAAESQE